MTTKPKTKTKRNPLSFDDRTVPARGAKAVPASPQFLRLLDLKASDENPRDFFDPRELEELAASIQAEGLLQNLVVRPLKGHAGKFEVLAGERRLRAIKLLVGRKKWDQGAAIIPVKILAGDSVLQYVSGLTENLQRADLSPIEEGKALARLRRFNPKEFTHKALAKRIHKSESYVRQRLTLVEDLTPAVQDAVKRGALSFDQARVLATVKRGEQADWLKKIKERAYGTETAAALREAVRRDLVPVKLALFDVEKSGLNLVTDPDSKEQFFTDLKKFRELQCAAARKESNRTGARFCDGYLDSSSWRPAKHGEKGERKSFIVVDHAGKVTRHENMVATNRAKDFGQSEQMTRDFKRREKEAEASRDFELALGEAIAALPASDLLPLKLVIFNWLTRSVGQHYKPRNAVEWAGRKSLLAFASYVKGGGPGELDKRATFRTICALPTADVWGFFAGIIGEHTAGGEYDRHAVDLFAMGLHEVLDVKAPKHLSKDVEEEKAEEAADRAGKSKGKAGAPAAVAKAA